MLPKLFNYYETDFNTLGLGTLSDCLSCEVTEAINGQYELEMRYKLHGILAEELEVRNIIVCQANDRQPPQAFRIYKVTASMNSIMVYARHISYDLSGYPIGAINVTGMTMLMARLNNSIIPMPFRFLSPIEDSSTKLINEKPCSIRSILGGKTTTIAELFGGEWEYDNFVCILRPRRGDDNGVRISYGKNLAGYEKQRSDDVFTHVMAFWRTVVDGNTLVESGVPQPTGINAPTRCQIIDVSRDFNFMDVLRAASTFTSRTHNGVAFTWSPTKCHVEGTATADAYTVLLDTRGQSFPDGITPGRTYQVKLSVSKPTGTQPNLRVGLYWNGGSEAVTFTKDGMLTIPTNCTGVLFRIFVASGTEVNADVSVPQLIPVGPTTEELNQAAQNYILANTLTVDSQTITAEILQDNRIELGDTVHINYGDSVTDLRVVQTTYDVLAEKYTELQLGELKQNIGETIKSVVTTSSASTTGSTTGITVDSELDADSVNPVQNKVVTLALEGKANEAALEGKVDKVAGMGLSENDFTDTLKDKLDSIASGAEVNVQADWNVTNTSSDAYIKNKPNLGSVKFQEIAIAGGGTGILTISSGKRFFLVTSGAYVAMRGLYIGALNNVGAVYNTVVFSASDVSFDISTANKLKIANGRSNSTLSVLLIEFQP